MTVLGQPIVNYDYYDNGWLENVRQVVNAVEQRFNFTYDDGGRRERLKYFNGASLVTETIYGFDNASRLLEMKHLNSVSQILEQVNYGYDANGNRTSMNRPSVTLPMPNQASNTSYNEANQMLSFNDKNITYDNNGNMASIINTCGTTNYTWNARNQLVGINGFKPDCTTLTASFKYDALGRRIEKTINGVITQYVYDGMDIVQEKNQSGAVTANYIRGLNIDEPLLRSTQNAVRFYMTDALGSVIALTDETGVIKTQYVYDPFGNVSISGEPSDNPFQYTGRENDGTGLYYYRSRYYSPELQRFISEDPIGFAGGDVNLYSYVHSNPVNFVDPLGLAIWICNRKTKAGIGNHAYLYNDRDKTCCGRDSAKNCTEKGPFGKDRDSCRKIADSDGKEDQVMQCCRNTADSGAWRPPVNDCHTAAGDCIEWNGLKNPGAPGGRVGKPCDPCSK
jgi:RHS repeat-associated protein